MLNIVLDNLNTSNVWFPKKPNCFPWFSKSLVSEPRSSTSKFQQPDHKVTLPILLYCMENFSIHNSANQLDTFIYPVSMPEPYIQVRSLIANQNAYGFWSHVSDSVIEALKEKRGWIIIDLHSEPLGQSDFDDMLVALSDTSVFPNDRILINVTSPHFADNKRVFCYPSHLELGCIMHELYPNLNIINPCPCHPKNLKKLDYLHKRFLLLSSHRDLPINAILDKYASKYPNLFLDSANNLENTFFSSRFLLLPNALYATDFNIAIEAYLENNVVEYPFLTEKTLRNIKYKKPFILLGQQSTLAALHKLGYKTFHPFVDESYDEIKDTELRCATVLRELNRLRKMNDTEWSNFLNNCKPIVEHNYNNLLRRVNQTRAWLEELKNL